MHALRDTLKFQNNMNPQICVTFREIFDPISGIKYAPYSICVYSSDFEDAQELAIDYVESLSMNHGEIIKMEKI